MHTAYHVTCSVDKTVIGVCGNVVQEHFNKLFCVYHCLSLSCADGIECYQQHIFNNFGSDLVVSLQDQEEMVEVLDFHVFNAKNHQQ
jgi:hypothetical protein